MLGLALDDGTNGLLDEAACSRPGARKELEEGEDETVADLKGWMELIEGRRPWIDAAAERS